MHPRDLRDSFRSPLSLREDLRQIYLLGVSLSLDPLWAFAPPRIVWHSEHLTDTVMLATESGPQSSQTMYVWADERGLTLSDSEGAAAMPGYSWMDDPTLEHCVTHRGATPEQITEALIGAPTLEEARRQLD